MTLEQVVEDILNQARGLLSTATDEGDRVSLASLLYEALSSVVTSLGSGTVSPTVVCECGQLVLVASELSKEIGLKVWKDLFVKLVKGGHSFMTAEIKIALTLKVVENLNQTLRSLGPLNNSLFFCQRLSCCLSYFGAWDNDLTPELESQCLAVMSACAGLIIEAVSNPLIPSGDKEKATKAVSFIA